MEIDQIVGAGFGVARYDFPSDREAHLNAIAGLGLSYPVEVVNDGMNGLLAGATRGIGVMGLILFMESPCLAHSSPG